MVAQHELSRRKCRRFAHHRRARQPRSILDQIAALASPGRHRRIQGGDPPTSPCSASPPGGPSRVHGHAESSRPSGRWSASPCPAPTTPNSPLPRYRPRSPPELGVRATVSDLSQPAPRALTDDDLDHFRKMPEPIVHRGPTSPRPPCSPVVDGDVRRARAGASPTAAARRWTCSSATPETSSGSTPPGPAANPPQPARARHSTTSHRRRTATGSTHRLLPTPPPASNSKFSIPTVERMPSPHLADAAHTGGGPVWLYELHPGASTPNRAPRTAWSAVRHQPRRSTCPPRRPSSAADEITHVAQQMRRLGELQDHRQPRLDTC